MSIFKRKKIEKESNIAETPENSKPKSEFSVAKFYYMIWYIFSLAFHICYVGYIIITIAQKNFLSQVIVYLLYAYAIALVLIILFSLGNKSKLKARLTDYKSAVNFLKYLIQMISFVLSFVTAVSSFFTTGKFDSVAMSSAITSLILTAIMAVFEFIKIMIRKNIPIVKQNFLRIKENNEIEKLQKNPNANPQYSGNINVSEDVPYSGNISLNEDENLINDNYSQTDENLSKIESNENILEEIQQNNENTTSKSLNKNPKKSLFNKFFKKNKIYLEQIKNLEQTDNQNDIKIPTESKEQSELLTPIIDEQSLSKNEKYDRDAGVIISYDDEDDDEDFEEFDNYESLDPAIVRATKQSNKFSKIIKKFMKK